MVRFVKKTPLVDGGGLKNTLEDKAASFLDKQIGDYINSRGRKVLVTLGADRWGLARAFADAGYETVYGDLMFGLDIPIAIHSIGQLKTFAACAIEGHVENLFPDEARVLTQEAYGKSERLMNMNF